MTETGKKSAEQWVELISKKELPAITSTAKLLDKFSNDDVSSLPKLSKSILHDQALSSCILKVANSIQHMGHSKVTTVSRATVVLGIHSVKNICLTSKLLEGLFKSKNFGPEVYQRLTQLMASSFYAGLLAKMMVPGYNEDTQEEVYLAAMLYRIGETAFWSIGDELAGQLIDDTNLSELEFNTRCKEVLGINFSDISKGLAKTWNLGGLLEKALDDPTTRTKEMQIIYLADKLSSFIASPPDSIDEFNDVLDEICKIKKITTRQLKERINQTRESAIDLLHSYGASILEESIKPLPLVSDFGQGKYPLIESEISQEKAQLMSLMQLTQLTKSSKDFNEFLQLALQSLAKTIGFDRSAFFMLTGDKRQVQSRFSYDKMAELENFNCKLDIKSSENIFANVLDTGQAILINNHTGVEWRNYMTKTIVDIIDDGAICLSPVQINNNNIGVIVGQKLGKKSTIHSDDFSGFCFLIEHLNMCLSMITRK